MIQFFEMTLCVSDEEMRLMQRDLDEVKTIVGESSALVTCFQDTLDNAEAINENSPNIPEARARDITLALARAALSVKAGNSG